jgi:hypothetical protein
MRMKSLGMELIGERDNVLSVMTELCDEINLTRPLTGCHAHGFARACDERTTWPLKAVAMAPRTDIEVHTPAVTSRMVEILP